MVISIKSILLGILYAISVLAVQNVMANANKYSENTEPAVVKSENATSFVWHKDILNALSTGFQLTLKGKDLVSNLTLT